MSLINKIAKIEEFVDKVVDPAVLAIKLSHDNVDTGGFTSALEYKARMQIGPQSFNMINPAGGRITASDLAALFQIYAYHLTAIRPAIINILTTTPPPAVVSKVPVDSGITALTSSFAMNLVDFNAKVTAAPNPLTNLQPGQIASEAALNALIDRLANICSEARAQAPINIEICHSSCHACHSSCHSSCHASRGRR